MQVFFYFLEENLYFKKFFFINSERKEVFYKLWKHLNLGFYMRYYEHALTNEKSKYFIFYSQFWLQQIAIIIIIIIKHQLSKIDMSYIATSNTWTWHSCTFYIYHIFVVYIQVLCRIWLNNKFYATKKSFFILLKAFHVWRKNFYHACYVFYL